MKSFKKIFTLTSAISMLAGLNILSVSASEHNFEPLDTTAGITIEQVTVSPDELAAANYQVPVMVKVNPNPGVNALEFGVKCNLDYEVITKNKEVKKYASLPTAGDSISDGLDAAMTVKSSTAEPGLTWMTYAAADTDETLENFVMLLVKVPEDAKSGDTYVIDYAEVGAGGASKNIFQVKENGTTTDYVKLNDFTVSDGFIKIEGETSTTSETTSTSTSTETTTVETTTKATETTSTTEVETTAVESTSTSTSITTSKLAQPITSVPAIVSTTTSNTTISSSTTSTVNRNGSTPKTGSSDVLPIAGVGAAVAVLGGIALVAKKKD